MMYKTEWGWGHLPWGINALGFSRCLDFGVFLMSFHVFVYSTILYGKG